MSTQTSGGQPTGTPLAALVEGVSSGDWASWREIVKRFGPLVLHTACQVGLSSADASDAAQQTWFALWKHAHQIREPEHLAAWLVVAARREAIRLATASSRYVLCADPQTEYSGGLDKHAVNDAYPVEGDYDGVVEQALDRLPARYRRLLELVTSDQCPTYAEIAARMRLPIGSIGPMRMRALEQLSNMPEFRSGRIPRPVLASAAA